MPGWIGHNISVNVKDAIQANIHLPSPCDGLADEINSDLMNISSRVNGSTGVIINELASQSQTLQVNALTSLGSNKTGRLAGSITVSGGGDSTRVGTDLFYATYVNDGRGTVTATGKALHFYVDGVEVFTKSVRPSTPKPYVDISGAMFERAMDDVVSKFMGSLL